MNVLLAWFARNTIAANLLMWLILVGGILSVRAIRTQTVGDYSFEIITISVPYPGAGPEEVDQVVCARIDESVRGLKNIRRVHAVATEGLCFVQVHLVHGTEVGQALDDVKIKIDAIDSFPTDVEEPVVQVFDPPQRVIGLILSGPADEGTLTGLGERVRDELAALPGVTLVRLSGVRPHEISIDVSEEELRRHGLTFFQVAEAVRRSSLDLPGGSVKTREAEILLRTRGQAYHRKDFEDLVVLSRRDGTRLTVGQVASVKDGFTEAVEAHWFNGEPAVLIDVFRVGDQSVTSVADRLKTYLDQIRPGLPAGIRLTVWRDATIDLRDRLGTLLANGRDGLVLVLIVLALFLRLRLAFWVALGIPISFLGTLWGMTVLDQPITLASLVGFIIALGIVVDDAIVVGENVYLHHQDGEDGVEAAVAGVCQVGAPVFFSVMTTIAAFSPMLDLPGVMGEAFRALVIVVILALTFSLIESLLVLPAHLSRLPRKATREIDTAVSGGQSAWERMRAVPGALPNLLVERVYLPVLHQALAWRATTVALALALFFVSLGLVVGGRVQLFFFRPVEANAIAIGLTLPQGTPVEVTTAALRHIERSVEELRRQLADEGERDALRHVLTKIGELPEGGFRFSDPARLTASGSHLGGVTVELAPGAERSASTRALGRRLRELVGEIPDAVDLSFGTSLLAAGKAIDIELAGTNLDELRLAATELRATLSGYPGVYGIADSLRVGKPEILISVTSDAEALGITLAELSRQVRQAFYGEEAQRLQRGRHELKVMVRYPENERRLLASLEHMRIRSPRGDEVPFAVAAQLKSGRGFASIERTDGRWTVRVSADVDRAVGDSNAIVQDLRQSVLPELTSAHGGVAYAFAGEQEEQRETLGALGRNTLLALFLIYASLAIASGSYLQPLIIMGAIPFGVVGAIWGHIVMGFPLTIWSLIGVVALAGVVVNDSLILVDFVNRLHRAGTPLGEALRRAGEARFRPIVLTSVTTFAGLAPLLFEKSLQAQFLIPIAISLAFGALFATLVTLFLVPVAYSLLAERTAIAASSVRDLPSS